MSKINSHKEEFSLPAQLEIANISSVQSEIAAYLASDCSEHHINGDQVERVTTPAMQMLIAAQHEYLANNGKPFTFQKISDAMREALADTGLLSLIEES